MKVCKINGCNRQVWSKGVCLMHTPKAPLKAAIGFRKQYKPKDEESINLMREFFLRVWKKRKEHNCENCGVYLGREPLSYMFDHILEKSKYPELKYEEENIQYLCLLCHDKKSRGFVSENQQIKINKIKEIFGK